MERAGVKSMKLTEEIEEFINLTITEHMGKEYAEWKIKTAICGRAR